MSSSPLPPPFPCGRPEWRRRAAAEVEEETDEEQWKEEEEEEAVAQRSFAFVRSVIHSRSFYGRASISFIGKRGRERGGKEGTTTRRWGTAAATAPACATAPSPLSWLLPTASAVASQSLLFLVRRGLNATMSQGRLKGWRVGGKA